MATSEWEHTYGKDNSYKIVLANLKSRPVIYFNNRRPRYGIWYFQVSTVFISKNSVQEMLVFVGSK